MPEPVSTGLVALAAAYLGKDGLNRLLGPTADYLGGEFRDLTKRRVEAVGSIFQNGYKKLGDRMEEPGEVPPRVLKEILNDGSFYTESISIEYMGGVLASSRTPQGRDDRGARMAKLVDRLTTYQLRTHFLIYASIKHVFAGQERRLGTGFERSQMQTFIPMIGYIHAMQFTMQEVEAGITHHLFNGLHDENLLEGQWRFGAANAIRTLFPNAMEPGIVCSPSVPGTELFLWAFGHGQKPLAFMFERAFRHVLMACLPIWREQ